MTKASFSPGRRTRHSHQAAKAASLWATSTSLTSSSSVLGRSRIALAPAALTVPRTCGLICNGANGTATYFVRMDRLAHTSQKVGLASAMAIVLLIIILICALLQNLFFKYVFKDADDGVEKARKQAAKIERQRARMARKNASVFKNGPSNKEKAVA